jgi:hypothetical protein
MFLSRPTNCVVGRIDMVAAIRGNDVTQAT